MIDQQCVPLPHPVSMRLIRSIYVFLALPVFVHLHKYCILIINAQKDYT